MEGLIGENSVFQNGLDLTIKTASTGTQDNRLKRIKPANPNYNSPWAYILECLLSEGYLCLRFGGGGGLLSKFYIVSEAILLSKCILTIRSYSGIPFLYPLISQIS